MVKNPPARQETTCNAEDLGSVLGLRKFSGEGNSNSLYYSSLESSWTEETGGLQSVLRVTRVGHNFASKPPPPPESYWVRWKYSYDCMVSIFS